MLVCLARDELLDRRPSWGGGRGSATQLLLEPLTAGRDARARGRAAARRGETVAAGGGRALRRQPAVRRGDGAPDRRGGRRRGGRAARHRAGACWPRGSTRSSPFERRLVQQAAVVGRTFWEGSLAPLAERRAARPRAARCIVAAGEGHPRPGRREPAGRRARAGLQARADPRRGLRDAAQGGALRASTSRSGASSRSAPATAPTRWWRCSPSTTAAPPRSGARAACRCDELDRDAATRACASSRRRATPPRCSTRTARRPRTTATRARSAPQDDRPTRARIGEKLGDVSLRLGRVDEAIEVWLECLDWHRGEEDLERVADLHRKIGAGALAQGRAQAGDRALPEGHQPAQGRPAAPRARAPLRGGRLALPAHRRQHARHLRLREGAAAGRAARRDARRQPRARDLRPRVRPHRRHREGAPEPRARGRAARRGSDHGETILALLGAGPPPRDLRGRRATARGAAYEEALALAEQVGDAARPGRAARRRSPSSPSTAPTGSAVERSTEASAELAEREGLVGKLCLPYALRGLLRWREGELDEADRARSTAPTSWPSRWAGRSSPSRRCSGWRTALRDSRRPRRRRDGARPRARRLRARRA